MTSSADVGPDCRCPSYAADNADVIIGVVGADGRVGVLASPIPATAQLRQRLRDTAPGEPLEARFRFSGTCQKSGCGSWRADHCGVIEDAIRDQSMPVQIAARLPHCAIRSSCRWWSEHGRAACDVCPTISTASTA